MTGARTGAPYLYCAANPLRLVDPSGLSAETSFSSLDQTTQGLNNDPQVTKLLTDTRAPTPQVNGVDYAAARRRGTAMARSQSGVPSQVGTYQENHTRAIRHAKDVGLPENEVNKPGTFQSLHSRKNPVVNAEVYDTTGHGVEQTITHHNAVERMIDADAARAVRTPTGVTDAADLTHWRTPATIDQAQRARMTWSSAESLPRSTSRGGVGIATKAESTLQVGRLAAASPAVRVVERESTAAARRAAPTAFRYAGRAAVEAIPFIGFGIAIASMHENIARGEYQSAAWDAVESLPGVAMARIVLEPSNAY